MIYEWSVSGWKLRAFLILNDSRYKRTDPGCLQSHYMKFYILHCFEVDFANFLSWT